MTDDEIVLLRDVSPSMGIMLESASSRLTEKGMPHYGSPDKIPEVRLDTLRRAGAARVPFTSGILIGIGETRLERIESLLALRAVHAAARPHSRNHRSEFPREGRHEDGARAGTRPRRTAVDDRRRADRVRRPT